MPTIDAAAVALQSKPTTTSALSITAPTTRAAVSTNTNPDSAVDLESLLSGPPTHCTSSLGRDSPACTDWLDINISVDLLTNLTHRWTAPNTPEWILEMLDEVNVNAADADISAHTDDEAEMESMLALYTAEGKEHTIELLQTTKKEKKCKSLIRKFCCATSFLLVPILCCATCNTGGPLGTEG